jgi:hypothetical protein
MIAVSKCLGMVGPHFCLLSGLLSPSFSASKRAISVGAFMSCRCNFVIQSGAVGTMLLGTCSKMASDRRFVPYTNAKTSWPKPTNVSGLAPAILWHI